jgi:ankyrin repeat protein
MGMHWAAYRGDVEVLQQLINAGGDVNAMGDAGNRPIHLAASADHLEVG